MEISQVSLKPDNVDLEKIAQKYDLRMILLFGSAISAKLHHQSDIDIAVLRQKPELGLKDYCDLLFDLQKLFSGREVDLALLNRADPLFLKKIVENCKLLYGHRRELAQLKIYAFKRYVDHQHFFDLENKFARDFIKRNLGGG